MITAINTGTTDLEQHALLCGCLLEPGETKLLDDNWLLEHIGGQVVVQLCHTTIVCLGGVKGGGMREKAGQKGCGVSAQPQ